MNNKNITSKLLIFLIIFTLVFTQGSFAFADTDNYSGESELQATEEELTETDTAYEAENIEAASEEVLTEELEPVSEEEPEPAATEESFVAEPEETLEEEPSEVPEAIAENEDTAAEEDQTAETVSDTEVADPEKTVKPVIVNEEKTVSQETERSQAAVTEVQANDTNDATPVSEIAYTGSELKFVKSDLVTTFGMLSPKAESTPSIKLSADETKVKIAYEPTNLTVYAGFYIEADIKIPSTWDESKFIAANSDGTYEFELSANYCGNAWPVAPVKRSDMSATTSSQYYIAIPSKDKLEKEEPAITIDEVKTLIEGLPNSSDVTEADRERIEAAQAGYEALSAEDQAQLDSETCPGEGQPYGRILESALWGLWSLEEVDNTTTLEPGTYDASTTPALSSSYSKGKSTSGRNRPWSVKSITVDKDHKVTAVLTVESSTYSDVIYQGKTYAKTNTSGNSEFNIPIKLNTTFYFSGVSTSMPEPIAFSVTTEIDESGAAPDPEKEADYSKVDAALAKVPKDLSIYTDDSVKALNKAIKAVVRGLKASEQAKVNAMAKAIEDAIKGLVEKEVLPDGSIALKVTNNTGMFKAESAYYLVKNGKEYLVMTMSGTGYHELYKGTYEQAVANGDGTKDKGNNSWIHGKVNSKGKWEFTIPLKSDESYVPCIAISNTYYQKYLNGENPVERSFFPRQFRIDRKAKTLVTDDYNETVDFKATSKVADFKVGAKASTKVVGGPNSNNYSISPTLVMQDSTYDEIIYPTVKDGKLVEEKAAIKNGKFYISLLNAPGIEAFKDKKAIEMKFHVASDAPYKAAGEYVKRTVTINKLAKTIVINGTPLAEKGSDKKDDIVDPDEPLVPEDPEDGSGDEGAGYAPAVDSSTTLKDGVYTPDSFSWSGGSGRLAYIRCNKIIVRNGQAYAEIEFASSNYDALRASGGTYTKEGGGNSVFTIPVNLNANNTIVGRTTAMSQEHWVEYTIYIGLAETAEEGEKAQEAKKEAAEAKMEISEEAPTIIGLETAEDEEEAVQYSKYFKIFSYENGVKMLSIDVSEKTALKEEYTENARKAAEASKSEDDVQYDEEGKIIAKSKGEYIEEMYRNNVVNYLLVPEDYEVPAGLDKEYIIITVPCEKSFVASQEVLAMMEELGCTDLVSLLGIDEKEIKSDALKKAVEDEKIKLAGNIDKPDFTKVVKGKPNVALLPGDLLPEEIKKDSKDKEKLEKEAKEKQEKLEKLESRFTALSVPVVIDRSAQEEDELAQAEWIKVYGVLFGCEEQANKIFDEKVEEAKKNENN